MERQPPFSFFFFVGEGARNGDRDLSPNMIKKTKQNKTKKQVKLDKISEKVLLSGITLRILK